MSARTLWLVGSVMVMVVVILPVASIVATVLQPSTPAWVHIRDNLLLGYVGQTLLLVLATLVCTVTLGSALAWFVTAHDFPGRRFLSVALVCPLAIPPYIGAYTYSAMTGYTGPLQVFLRNVVGVTPPPGLLSISNLPGAVFIFTIFLYPYVYLVVYAFLHRQANQMVEAARMLGSGRWELYWRIVLPLTRNAMIAGGTLVAFEVMSDYGVVSYFGLNVFTTAIFKSWLGLHDIGAALRLSAILVMVVTGITVGEKVLRGHRSHSYSTSRIAPLVRQRLAGWQRVIVMVVSHGVFLVALVIPVAQMIYWAILSVPNIRLANIGGALLASLLLGLVGATLTTAAALLVANHQRLWRSRFSVFLARVSVVGYSIPSTVIALSILILVVAADRVFGTGLALTPALVVLAYVIRFLAVSMQNVEAGFERVGSQFAEASRSMGRGPLATLLRVDVPMMSSAVTGAFLLAFIDIVKELPIVLILRPFNFSTLSTRVFAYANDEQIPESSLASLLIITLAMGPLLAWNLMGRRGERAAALAGGRS